MSSWIKDLWAAIVEKVKMYFKDKEEIKKVEQEANKMLITAEAEAKATKLKREAEMDYDLDKIAMQNMDKTWKDELILLIWLVPVVLSFIPEYQQIVVDGFATLGMAPDWYMYILVGMIVVIYGMRGLVKLAIEKIGFKK